jgi:hypothetical protein
MKKIILMILLISLVGCAYNGTVKSQLNDNGFQKENLPFRTLSVCVISEGSWPKERIETTLSDLSNLMAEQVGIQLRVDRWIDHPVPSFVPTQGLQNLVEIIGKEHQNYDLVIGFSSRGLASNLIEMASWTAWLGAIDDSYRKFIIIKFLDERVIEHEICHAFVFDRRHSVNGVLSAAIFKLPLAPFLFNMPRYVSMEDRQEILRNKWRDFNKKPVIPEKYQADTVEMPTAENK